MPDSTLSVGVVGLGLMGTSITACILAAGHPVIAADSNPAKRRSARSRIARHLREMASEGLLRRSPEACLKKLEIAIDISRFAGHGLAIEAVFEGLDEKREVIRQLEKVLSRNAIIGSNTSAIPVTDLQAQANCPARIIGIHWAEPAHITRFMEIVCGAKTKPAVARRVVALAEKWGKEPTLVRRDVRGFITNRIMYAMIREAFHLVETGVATPADIDRSVRNDMGYWMTFAGPFRFMDITGIPAYAAVMQDLLPDLCNTTDVPALMRKTVTAGARFYKYTPAQARKWDRQFLKFTYDIRRIALKYKSAT